MSTCHLQGDYSDKIGEVLKSGLEGTARSRDAGFKVDKAGRGLEEDALGLEVQDAIYWGPILPVDWRREVARFVVWISVYYAKPAKKPTEKNSRCTRRR